MNRIILKTDKNPRFLAFLDYRDSNVSVNLNKKLNRQPSAYRKLSVQKMMEEMQVVILWERKFERWEESDKAFLVFDL